MNKVKRSQEKVSHFERQANIAILQANSEKEEAKKKKAEYNNLIAVQKKLITEKAEQLNEQYRNKYQLIWFVILAYSVMTTLLTGYQSERVVADFTNAATTVKDFCISGFMAITILIEKIGSIGEKIEQPVISQIVSFVVGVIVFMAILGVILALLYFGGKFIVNVYKDNCFDEISLFVIAITIVVLVWFAELMPLNVVLLLFLSQVVYVVIRWYIKKIKMRFSLC